MSSVACRRVDDGRVRVRVRVRRRGRAACTSVRAVGRTRCCRCGRVVWCVCRPTVLEHYTRTRERAKAGDGSARTDEDPRKGGSGDGGGGGKEVRRDEKDEKKKIDKSRKRERILSRRFRVDDQPPSSWCHVVGVLLIFVYFF